MTYIWIISFIKAPLQMLKWKQRISHFCFQCSRGIGVKNHRIGKIWTQPVFFSEKKPTYEISFKMSGKWKMVIFFSFFWKFKDITLSKTIGPKLNLNSICIFLRHIHTLNLSWMSATIVEIMIRMWISKFQV